MFCNCVFNEILNFKMKYIQPETHTVMQVDNVVLQYEMLHILTLKSLHM